MRGQIAHQAVISSLLLTISYYLVLYETGTVDIVCDDIDDNVSEVQQEI